MAKTILARQWPIGKKLDSSSNVIDEDLVEIVDNLDKKDLQVDQLNESVYEGKSQLPKVGTHYLFSLISYFLYCCLALETFFYSFDLILKF